MKPDSPLSVADEAGRARAVQAMFASIARRYDFLNHLLSANVDRRWRRVCADELRGRMTGPAHRILDIGCGTADLSLACAENGLVYGCDFCHPMLVLGKGKVEAAGRRDRVYLLGGDALRLPFFDASFDAVVSAFVLRNLAEMEQGLREMRRVLRPGGAIGILDFGMPDWPLLGAAYRFYFGRILPALGRLVSGVQGPYRYLNESVRRFPPPAEMCVRIAAAGFYRVRARPLTGGIALLFLGNALD